MNTPKYAVRFIVTKKEFTFYFYSPKYALNLAVSVVREGHTLLSVEQ